MQNINSNKKYAPPTRCEKKIGNTTFVVNSYFPEDGKDSINSKVERLIRDDARKETAKNNLR